MQEIYLKQQFIFVFIEICQQTLLKLPTIEDPFSIIDFLYAYRWTDRRIHSIRVRFPLNPAIITARIVNHFYIKWTPFWHQ
jgi:hypothetical protein